MDEYYHYRGSGVLRDPCADRLTWQRHWEKKRERKGSINHDCEVGSWPTRSLSCRRPRQSVCHHTRDELATHISRWLTKYTSKQTSIIPSDWRNGRRPSWGACSLTHSLTRSLTERTRNEQRSLKCMHASQAKNIGRAGQGTTAKEEEEMMLVYIVVRDPLSGATTIDKWQTNDIYICVLCESV